MSRAYLYDLTKSIGYNINSHKSKFQVLTIYGGVKLKNRDVVNVNSASEDPVERALSNFSDHRPWIGRESFSCVEKFIQWIKFPKDDPTRGLILKATPLEAKRLGKKARNDFVYWMDRKIIYGSEEHHELIERAIRAKFKDNPDAMEALLSTGKKIITHEVGVEDPATSLPKDLFCRILTNIREENSITMEKLVVLIYADNECYVQVVSVKEAMEKYGNGFFSIDQAKRIWQFGKKQFKIGSRRECKEGSRGGVIGVYNRQSIGQLDSMAHAATNAVSSHTWSCD